MQAEHWNFDLQTEPADEPELKPADKVMHCEKHGDYLASLLFRTTSGNERWTDCPACVEADRLAYEAQELAKEAARLAEWKAERLLDCGISGRYERSTFDNFEVQDDRQRRARDAVRAFADKAGQGQTTAGLFLIGTVGAGKTHLAAAAVRHTIEVHARNAMLVTASGMVQAVRATWNRQADRTEAQVIDELASCRLLVIDDVGAGLGTEAEAKTLLDVIDRRYTRELPTLIVSNLQLSGIRQVLGDRSYDRLREGARCVLCDWPSYRGRT